MKRLFFDMDGVLADFESGIKQLDEETLKVYEDHYEEVPGFFSLLAPIGGAIKAVKTLAKHYDVFILSWITKHFHGIFYKKIILTHRKDLVVGDYLIDDRSRNGASEFSGEWIHFGSERFPDWDSVISYLSKKDNW